MQMYLLSHASHLLLFSFVLELLPLASEIEADDSRPFVEAD